MSNKIINNIEFQKLQLWLNFWKTIARLIAFLIFIVSLTFYLSDQYFKIIELKHQLDFKKQENLSHYLKYTSEYRANMSPSFMSSFVSTELGELSESAIEIDNNHTALDVIISGKIQKGIASFYADKFQGRPTASGELFDNNALTAAHRTLPFGTMIKVTNTKTGQSVVVKVNDRGPFVGNKILDLSKVAAQNIGIVEEGSGEVIIEKVLPT